MFWNFWSRPVARLLWKTYFSRPKYPRPACTGFLKTLVHRGYVAQGQSGQYRLVSRPKRLRFGFAAQSAEMPFSVAVAASITAAAAAAGVELLQLDNRYDPDVAIKNAEEFVAKRVDLVLEFQVEEHVAPHVAHIFKKAEIPLVAIDVPHPNATYFGVDNFEVGYEAGVLLAKYASSKWKGKVPTGCLGSDSRRPAALCKAELPARLKGFASGSTRFRRTIICGSRAAECGSQA
jgi:ribose transport system substrate-binding protein